MRRREFIAGLGGAVTAWPLPVRAQQSERMKRIGVLVGLAENDSEGQARIGAFREGLRELGWMNGSNVRIDYRWAEDADRRRAYAAELVQLAPDVIVAAANPAGAAMQQATRTIPIVVPQMADPVTNGFVTSLARPGGNITGFFLYDDGFGAKWLEVLKEIAPRVNRVAVIYDPTNRSWAAMLREIEVAAFSFGVQLAPTGVRNAADIERGIDAFAREANGGLIVFPSPITTIHRESIVALAARYRLPTVYPYRFFTTRGGLVSYGGDNIDMYRRAASYVDRILKGEMPISLPVQQSTKFELVINLKTAKEIGIDVPPTLLARADEVIE